METSSLKDSRPEDERLLVDLSAASRGSLELPSR